MIYTSENRALALAEIVVHLTAAALPEDYVMLKIEIPDSLRISEIVSAQLAAGWNVFPHTLETQKLGDNFIRNGSTAILKVPSAVVHGDYNFLINPLHKGIEKIKISDIQGFPLDNRLF
jgi:RES domain-containing protein